MKVAVLIKQTPDTAELPKVVADDVRAGKVKATMVINPWDEYAAEEAIQLKAGGGGRSARLRREDESSDADVEIEILLEMGVLVKLTSHNQRLFVLARIHASHHQGRLVVGHVVVHGERRNGAVGMERDSKPGPGL